MIIKCLIIDDEPPARRLLESYIKNFPELELVKSCKDAFEAREMLQTHDIDLIFLDINMPRMTGLNFLRSLRRPPLTIISTAYRDYAVEGFELDVIDYLKKPFPIERFYQAIEKVHEKLSANVPSEGVNIQPQQISETIGDKFLFIKEDKRTFKIFLKDILYVESVGDYVKVITKDSSHITLQTMKYNTPQISDH